MNHAQYDSTLDIVEIAKRVRASIKAMQKAGLFSDMKAGVRIERYSMGQALHVTITKWAGPIHNPAWARADRSNPEDLPRYAPRAAKALAVLRILADGWNYNNSDSMTDYYDVNYALSVNFDTELHSADYRAARGEE